MIAATICFATGWVCVKLLGSHMPSAEIAFFRAFIGLIILAPIAYKRTGSLRGKNHKLLVIRGIVGGAAMLLSFYSMTKINLGDAALLLNTFPLFVAFLAPFFLKEPSRPAVFVLIAIAFVGIGFILKPTNDLFNAPAFAGLAGGFLVAFAMMAIRRLHATDSTWVIATWFSGVTSIVALPLLLFDFVMPTMTDAAILIGSGAILTVSQVLLTKAYQYAPASIIAPFAYMSVIWSYGFDLLLWKHAPDVWSALGAVVVIGCSVGIIQLARRPVVRPGAPS
jgi:drug/metabolite transporter (DMT)-like permease